MRSDPCLYCTLDGRDDCPIHYRHDWLLTALVALIVILVVVLVVA